MLSKKLDALQYELDLNIEDEISVRNLVYWLENMKIRFYPPEGRDGLYPEASNWSDFFAKYLDEISYDGPRDDKKKIIDFLLNLALQYEMEDKRSQMQISKEHFADLGNSNSSSDILLDVNSSEFIDGLKGLAALLNVPFYSEEPLITLKAIAILLKRLNKSSFNASQISQSTSDNNKKKKRLSSQVDETILKQPFSKVSKYDPVLNRAANVLRLLYINDLRDLQTQINTMIVQVQSLTANPRTDTTLGLVGR